VTGPAKKINGAVALGLILGLGAIEASAHNRSANEFTLPKQIHMWRFTTPYGDARPVMMAPDRRFVAVWAERGLVRKNLIEDDLRIYSMKALRRFVDHSQGEPTPAPVINLREATWKEGPIISQIQWLPRSTGLAFLLKDSHGTNELAILDLRQRRVRILSKRGQDVTAFCVRDGAHFAYTVASPGNDLGPSGRKGWVAWDATGESLKRIVFPSATLQREMNLGNRLRSVLWSALGGPPHLVLAYETDRPIVLYPALGGALSMSPTGDSLATTATLANVPVRWIRGYPSQPNSPFRLHAGRQDLNATRGSELAADEYVVIDLRSGRIKSVSGGPTGVANGWFASGGAPAWSGDGKALLLPNAYVKPSKLARQSSRPCVAVVLLASGKMQCIEPLKASFSNGGSPEAGYFTIRSFRFDGRSHRKVVIGIERAGDRRVRRKLFVRGRSGAWRFFGDMAARRSEKGTLNVSIKQRLNEPPVLSAVDEVKREASVIWDPNPEMARLAVVEATNFVWGDSDGRKWTGGLYRPLEYVKGKRYPLVIQTHGFDEGAFRASGLYPTAFAARTLAADGIMVLQAPVCPVFENPNEGPCQVSEYEGAIRALVSQGLVDADRIGMIGWSRTVYYVLEALTSSKLRIAAASVTDGIDGGYWQYLALEGANHNLYADDFEHLMGARPFRAGLRKWLNRSPEFNMSNVRAPLLVVSLGRDDITNMWEPYALLRYLHKPVDLLVLNTDEHVLSNPAERIASQGSSVDWFRFWLQGYIDPSAAKAAEYRRWEGLCDMQRSQSGRRKTFCVPSTAHGSGEPRSE
jgi:hypothetical protein